MSRIETNKVPPDGGYGWVVTFAYALNNVVVLPLIAGFGLVLQGTDLPKSQATIVIVSNHSVGMLLSLFGGPGLSRFGYRRVAVLGAIFISVGLVLTSMSTEFWQFLLSYSIICSMGISAIMAAFTLAINSFFKEKRGRAVGVGMSITGLGAIYMPLLMSALMDAYGWRYAVLILSAICLHSLVAACLLRPAKWYLKAPPVSEEEQPLNEVTNTEFVNGVLPILPNGAIEPPARYKWWESQEVNLGSSVNIFAETDNIQEKKTLPQEKKAIGAKIVEFFDLTLLKDPVFVNMIFGLSVAAGVETSFSLVFPFILNDMLKFETSEIAQIMSVIGFSDTLFRFVSPFIGEWCNKSPRVMYMVSLLMIIFVRSIMLFTTSFIGMLIVSFAFGITKALRTVYVNIVIPNYVPIHRLPFASGMQMFFNGFTIFIIGWILTRVRESSGSYIVPIIVLNFFTMLTIISWSIEFLYFRLKDGASSEQTPESKA